MIPRRIASLSSATSCSSPGNRIALRSFLRPIPSSLQTTRLTHSNHHHSSNPTPEEQLKIDSAQEWLDQLTPAVIPKSILDVKFIRSSGPGGQKVNKTSSKAMIHINGLGWIPDLVKSHLLQNNFRYLNKFQSGFTLADDTTRSREDNLSKCLEKFIQEIKQSVKFRSKIKEEDLEKWKNVRKKTNEERLKEKHKKSDKKASRRDNKKVDYY
ncbi:hypothetical protein WICPIJ_007973 [Wickerhamomyces pijperi]|uniref:Prokaryotic-type class I peptide chain release factors domain-containing protein n=1 Tax=Wickerhamomyces pijperi TaxID=599730 RepID=A0A9P8Q1J4_WICPI|nr:hypothetical protein WICPIJ_007973 [Wickerhamomyces pijperi]